MRSKLVVCLLVFSLVINLFFIFILNSKENKMNSIVAKHIDLVTSRLDFLSDTIMFYIDREAGSQLIISSEINNVSRDVRMLISTALYADVFTKSELDTIYGLYEYLNSAPQTKENLTLEFSKSMYTEDEKKQLVKLANKLNEIDWYNKRNKDEFIVAVEQVLSLEK